MSASTRRAPDALGPRLRAWHAAGNWIEFRGHELFYRDAGAGAPLLLLHAYPTAGWGWHRVWDALAAGWRPIAPDLLGSGFSAKPRRGPYTIAELADQAEAVLAARGVDAVDVWAHAYGVSAAQELLARQAEGNARVHLRSVAFIDGGLFPDLVALKPMQRLLTGPLGPLIATWAPQPYAAFRRQLVAAFGVDTRPGATELAELWQLLRFNGGHRVTPWVMQYLHDRARHAGRLTGALASADVPLQLIHVAGDPIIGDATAARWRREVARGELAELQSPVGHYPPLEAPAEVLAAYAAFRRRIGGDPGSTP